MSQVLMHASDLMSTFSVCSGNSLVDKNSNLVMSLNVETTANNKRVSNIRYVSTESGPMLAEIDVTMMVTGLLNKAAGQKLRRMCEDSEKATTMEVIHQGSIMHKFNGRNQLPTTLITLDNAIVLIMTLTGKTADAYKIQFASVLKRYFAGDPTLVPELIANNMSDAPMNVLAREAAGVTQMAIADNRDDDNKKRRRMELYDRAAEHKRALQLLSVQGGLSVKQHEQRVKELQLEDETKAKEHERMMQAKKVEDETKAKEHKRALELLEGQKEVQRLEIKKLEMQKAPQTVPLPTAADAFVTITSVASNMKLDKLLLNDKSAVKKVLQNAGKLVAKEIQVLPNKVVEPGTGFSVNAYPYTAHEILREKIEQAMQEYKQQGGIQAFFHGNPP